MVHGAINLFVFVCECVRLTLGFVSNSSRFPFSLVLSFPKLSPTQAHAEQQMHRQPSPFAHTNYKSNMSPAYSEIHWWIVSCSTQRLFFQPEALANPMCQKEAESEGFTHLWSQFVLSTSDRSTFFSCVMCTHSGPVFSRNAYPVTAFFSLAKVHLFFSAWHTDVHVHTHAHTHAHPWIKDPLLSINEPMLSYHH